jgi:hypothetical protein
VVVEVVVVIEKSIVKAKEEGSDYSSEESCNYSHATTNKLILACLHVLERMQVVAKYILSEA